MGCISSKEMKQRSGRTSKDVPALPEDLLVSRKGSNHNHFLALVCTATSITDAFRPKSLRFDLPVSPAETEANEAILRPDPVNDKDRRIGEYEMHPDPPKRSRSWHSFPLKETPSSDEENHDVIIDTSELHGKGAIRSRSFHTIEEYDKLLERIWLVSLADKSYIEADPVEKEVLMTPTGMNCQFELNNADSLETLQPLQGSGSLDEESSTNAETAEESFPGNSTLGPERKDLEEQVSVETGILGKSSIKQDDPQERRGMAKGFKRKSVARGLETLKIPSTFELPAVASLREWLPTGQVFSPGVHPTPKFGSCLVSTHTTTNDEEIIFNEELVTALEEQLQQLKTEEETILKHMTATWEDSASTVIKEDIAISQSMQLRVTCINLIVYISFLVKFRCIKLRGFVQQP